MPGRKRKFVPDAKEVAAYRQKLRKRPPAPPQKLPDKECMKYTIKSPFPQRFSIPPNILLYVAQNPSSPTGHLKLISTCKALARMSRILPVKMLQHCDDDDDGNKWRADYKVLINLKDQYFKLSIFDEIRIWTDTAPNVASTLIEHGCKFSLRAIDIRNQVLSFEELQILLSAGRLEYVFFCKNVVKNSDGSVTEFEKVFQLFCCEYMTITFHPEQHGMGENTTKKIIEMLSSEQFPAELDIGLINIPENFDFHLFSVFLKANMTDRQHAIYLNFADEISDDFKNQVQEFINEIIQIREIFAHTIPYIRFRGQNEEARRELLRLRFNPVERILRKPGYIFMRSFCA